MLKQVPKSIVQRLSDISSSEDIFKQAAPEYQCNGFTDKLLYEPRSREERQTENAEKKRRKRKVILYNPPYSVDAQTNIGKSFLRLLRKHFNPTHILYKIFNDKTLKLSYCCMPCLMWPQLSVDIIKAYYAKLRSQKNRKCAIAARRHLAQ